MTEFIRSSITLLDMTMRKDEIRVLKSLSEVLGFNITNNTGEPLFVEPIYEGGNLIRLIIYKEPK